MLDRIFGSELKVKIIGFLLSQNPGQGFSHNDIAKALSLKGSVWRRELSDLVELGLVKAELLNSLEQAGDEREEKQKSPKKTKSESSKKNKVEKFIYKIDESFFVYSEIKSLFAKSRILSARKIFKEMEEQCRPKLIILTGKFVGRSDDMIDLLIVGNSSKRNFLKLLEELELIMGEEINYSLMTEEEFKYRRYVMDIFLYNIIESDNMIISGNVADISFFNKEASDDSQK